MEPLQVTTTYQFKKEDIDDFISTALEGGINYWCRKAKIKFQPENTEIEYSSDVVSIGGSLLLYDAETSETWELTLDKMLKGIKMHCEKANITPAYLVENYDASDVDCIIQYALFDEIVFG